MTGINPERPNDRQEAKQPPEGREDGETGLCAGRGICADDGEARPSSCQSPSASSVGPQEVAPRPFDITPESEKLYTDYLQEINKRELSGSENFDKAVLTLSSAGLGVSVTLLKDVIQLDQAVFLPVLYGSWSLFAVAIASTLISFMLSAKALDYQKALASRFYRQGDEAAFIESNRFDKCTRVLNIVSAAAFVVALVLTPAFVGLNLEKNRMSANKNTPNNSWEQRGLPVPSMQRPASAPTPAAPAAPASTPAPPPVEAPTAPGSATNQ